MRRHPDIRWLRRAEDIPRLVAEQQALLRAAWALLAPGGRLLYASCAILRAETEGVVGDFLAAQADARELPLSLPVGEPLAAGWRIPPGGAWDGFYYALLGKADAGTDADAGADAGTGAGTGAAADPKPAPGA